MIVRLVAIAAALPTLLLGAYGLSASFAPDLGLHEVSAAANIVSEKVDADVNFIFGTTIDPDLQDEVQVCAVCRWPGIRISPAG